MSNAKPDIKPSIAKSKRDVKDWQSLNEWKKELTEKQTGPKKTGSWKIHLSQKQWQEDMKKLTPLQRCILIELAFHRRNNDNCWPSLTLIAKNLHTDRTTIYRNMPSLAKKRLVKIVKNQGKVNHYKPLLSF